MIPVNVLKECPRCGADTHMSAEAQPHLCGDIAKRLKRREAQRDAVLVIFAEYGVVAYPATLEAMAEAVVKRLMNMGVTDD